MKVLLLLLVAAFFSGPTEAPANWTANPRPYQNFVERPDATDCRYWGAAEIGNRCSAYLVLGSSPKNLKCKVDAKFNYIVVCTWDKPVTAKKGELGR